MATFRTCVAGLTVSLPCDIQKGATAQRVKMGRF